MRAASLLGVCLTFAVLAAAGAARAQNEGAGDARETTFGITSFAVGGNTLLPADNVARVLAGFTGPRRTSKDVEAARDALEKLFHDVGYPTVLANIPEQTVESGVIRLEVIASRVGEVKVTGNRHVSTKRILESLPSLAPGEVIFLPRVRREILKVNANPDLKVIPGMTPSKEVGVVDVDLKVEDRLPLHGSLELNNRATRDTTALRLNATLRYDDLWRKGHSLSVQYQVSPEKPSEVQFFSGSYALPLAQGSDDRLALYAVRSDSATGFGEGFKTVGKGTIAGARYVKTLPVVPDFGPDSHSVTFGIDYKDFEESTGFEQSGGQSGTDTAPVTYLPLSVAYTGLFQGASGATQVSAGLNLVLRGLVSDERRFAENRFMGRGNYLYATAGVERSQALPGSMHLFGKLDGQIASQPLVSSEQYSAGGMESVRGYRESEAPGDDTVHGTVELQGPDVARAAGVRAGYPVTPYLFYDAAALWTLDPLPGQARTAHLQGAGAGVRGAILSSVEYEADGAVALSGTDATPGNSVRLHFRIKYQF